VGSRIEFGGSGSLFLTFKVGDGSRGKKLGVRGSVREFRNFPQRKGKEISE
jgi:hypothetical protein